MPRAVVLGDSGDQLRVEDLDLADVGPDQVRVRIAAAGVCHSDLHVWQAGAPGMQHPLVLGHEGAGEVVAVGSDVLGLCVGDHVVLCTIAQCGDCMWCRNGQATLCRTYAKTATGTLPDGSSPFSLGGEPVGQMAGIGCWSTEVVVHERSAVRIEDSIPLTSAALLGCAVVTGFGAVSNSADVKPGDTMAVLGCGGVGLSAVQAGRIAGAGRIIAIDVNPRKLKLALELGATDAIDSSDCDPVEQVNERTSQLGTEFAFDFVGTGATARAALQMARRGGTLILTGLAHPELAFSINDLIRSGRTIKGNTMGMGAFRSEYPKLVDLYREGALRLDELISQRLSIEQVDVAFAAMEGGDVARSVLVMT